MTKKNVIITGANSGIGKAAAVKFASEGYSVIMACRDIEKSKEAQSEIIQASQNREVELMKLDVSSFDSIQAFCGHFNNRYPKLDILINNAAYFNHGEKQYQLSPDNVELTFATNTFGPFLLTQLLLDSLAKSDDPRVLNACTTNIRHFFDPKRKIEFDNLRGEYKESRPYRVYTLYGNSKMALLMLTFRMADECKPYGIAVNAVQIPAIKTSEETRKKFKGLWRLAATVQNSFAQEPETMADTYFYICTSAALKGVTGKLFDKNREIVRPSQYAPGLLPEIKQFLDQKVYPKYAEDRATSEKVWDLSTRLTKDYIHFRA
jgi:NAD(P)-dependent dehydrogenase (short-subunit alcohol dehydrogenase family)